MSQVSTDKYFFNEKEHIHSLNGIPLVGTSTACQIIAKPLTWWAAAETLRPLGWIRPKVLVNGKYKFLSKNERNKNARPIFKQLKSKQFSLAEYLKLLDICYHAHNQVKDDAADKGVDRHAILEAWVKRCIAEADGRPIFDEFDEPGLIQFVDWAQRNIKKFLWSEIHGYSKILWTGGIADVGWEDHQGRIIAGDFKSSKDVYFTHFVQIGGYDLMLSENGGFTFDGQKIFDLSSPIQGYCTIPFGQKELSPVIVYNIEDYKQAFKAAVELTKLNNKYKELIKSLTEVKVVPAELQTDLAAALASMSGK